jgi:hypothetical protein
MTDINPWLDANLHLVSQQKTMLADERAAQAERVAQAEARDDARHQLTLRAMLVSAQLSHFITISDDEIDEAIDRADRVLNKLRA